MPGLDIDPDPSLFCLSDSPQLEECFRDFFPTLPQKCIFDGSFNSLASVCPGKAGL